MIEKVNPSHPDKIADRIAGALVDYAYTQSDAPKIAVEVLIGHRDCHIIAETSVNIPKYIVEGIARRITGDMFIRVDYVEVPQDTHLADNQSGEIKCGDNGIFKGVPLNDEEKTLSSYVRMMYEKFPTDGKFIYSKDDNKLIICQSNASELQILQATTTGLSNVPELVINPLGEWTGGTDVDTGATNRKLGSDMGRAVTGGGLHGKDLSKADVAINIYAHLIAQSENREVDICCAIGDAMVDGKPYSEIVRTAKYYIDSIGGFEKLAEWGLF